LREGKEGIGVPLFDETQLFFITNTVAEHVLHLVKIRRPTALATTYRTATPLSLIPLAHQPAVKQKAQVPWQQGGTGLVDNPSPPG
jgi:hypothetical protein